MLRDEPFPKAVPTVFSNIFIHTEENIAGESAGSIESMIKQKQRSQNSGPHVEP